MATSLRFFGHKKVLISALVLIFMAILSQEADASPSPMSMLLERNFTGARVRQGRPAAKSLVPRHQIKRDDGNSQDTNTTRAKGTQIYNNATDPSSPASSDNSTAAPLTNHGHAVAVQHALRQVYHEVKAMIKHNRTSSTSTGSVLLTNINGKIHALPSLSLENAMSGMAMKKADIPRTRFCATSSKRIPKVDELSQTLQIATMREYEELALAALSNALLSSNQTAASAAAAAANGTNTTTQDPASQTIANNATIGSLTSTTSNFSVDAMMDLSMLVARASPSAAYSKSNTSSLDYLHKLRSSASLVIQEMIAAREIEVPVYFNVIHNGQTGMLSKHDVHQQMRMLNRAFLKTGYKFVTKDIIYTDNKTWFHKVLAGNSVQTSMKNALHKGNASTLNLYTVDFPDEEIAYSTYPWDYPLNNAAEDGIVFAYASTPGGKLTGYNEGKTLVHQVGHWLGLFHTFEGGCTGFGDGVRDTPAQSSSSIGCPAKKNSCPHQLGMDAVHNYMDFTSDACRTQFTQGQVVRMHALSKQYRGL